MLLVQPGSPPSAIPVPGIEVGIAPKTLASTDPTIACFAFAANTRDAVAWTVQVQPAPRRRLGRTVAHAVAPCHDAALESMMVWWWTALAACLSEPADQGPPDTDPPCRSDDAALVLGARDPNGDQHQPHGDRPAHPSPAPDPHQRGHRGRGRVG